METAYDGVIFIHQYMDPAMPDSWKKRVESWILFIITYQTELFRPAPIVHSPNTQEAAK
jgi:hypothetical protein